MRAMTLKLCPLLSLLLTVVSCGKKATSSGTDEENPRIDNQVPASNLILEFDTSKGKTLNYKVPKNGTFALPDMLKIKNGSLPGRKISITYDINPTNPADFAIQCDYVTSSVEPDLMDVETCYDVDGNDIGNYTSEPLPMHANYLVKMELQGANSLARIFAYFTVEWK
jgi:hypothetical protein